jgi:hypothetical protein
VASAREVFFRSQPLAPDEQTALEASFFKSISTVNGTHKTTAPARLRDVDELVCDHLTGSGAVHLLDVGISSGVTTLELLERLDRAGVRPSGFGVDVCVHGLLCSSLGVDVLYDSAGRAVQLATPFFTRGRPHRTQRSLRSRLLRAALGAFDLRPVRWWMQRPRRTRHLDLVSRRLLERPDFRVRELDVARPVPEWSGSFDLIRAANVLNLDYFPEEQLVAMVQNLTIWLKPGGRLVICRTHAADGSNHGTLYQKRADSSELLRVRHFGTGYELDHRIAGPLEPAQGSAR